MFLKIKRIISLLLSNFVIYFIIPYKKKCFITCAGKTDGLGAQAQAIYSAQLYSFVNNLTYCHTPLAKIEHNYDNNPSFNEETERFFSFSKGEKDISSLNVDHKIINLDNLSFHTIYQICRYVITFSPKVIFQKSHYHNYTNRVAAKYILIKKQLQDKFYTNPKKSRSEDYGKCLHIAYHIRRGDVKETDTDRYTDNQIIFNKLNEFIAVLNQMNIRSQISIYSQGKKNDFGKLQEIATLYLNENVFDDFYSLVKADVFFMAKSSFSYAAALLSEGIIIYEPFWHPPLNDWYISEKEFHISEIIKKRLLSTYSLK